VLFDDGGGALPSERRGFQVACRPTLDTGTCQHLAGCSYFNGFMVWITAPALAESVAS
jgi:hypothetical protein